ncbi:MAG TPA: hypothetical protein VK624_05480 [Steroidobacteraceae bacterium]|nr:hypothetical protein [Steroidobacteraceae bacterium]
METKFTPALLIDQLETEIDPDGHHAAGFLAKLLWSAPTGTCERCA